MQEYIQEEFWNEEYWDTIQSLSRIAADIQNMRENPYATLNSISDSYNLEQIGSPERCRPSEEVQ